VLTTETLEGVATPVTAPLLLVAASLEDELPLQPASMNASAAKPMPSLEMIDILCLIFMTIPLVRCWYKKKKHPEVNSESAWLLGLWTKGLLRVIGKIPI